MVRVTDLAVPSREGQRWGAWKTRQPARQPEPRSAPGCQQRCWRDAGLTCLYFAAPSALDGEVLPARKTRTRGGRALAAGCCTPAIRGQDRDAPGPAAEPRQGQPLSRAGRDRAPLPRLLRAPRRRREVPPEAGHGPIGCREHLFACPRPPRSPIGSETESLCIVPPPRAAWPALRCGAVLGRR